MTPSAAGEAVNGCPFLNRQHNRQQQDFLLGGLPPCKSIYAVDLLWCKLDRLQKSFWNVSLDACQELCVYENNCLHFCQWPVSSLWPLFFSATSEALPRHRYTLVLCILLCLISTCEKTLKQKRSQPLFITRPLPSGSTRLLPVPVRWLCCFGQDKDTLIVVLTNIWLIKWR